MAIMFLINYLVCIVLLLFIQKRICLEDALFISVVYTTLILLSRVHIKSAFLGLIGSSGLTYLLFFRIYVPIRYPVEENEKRSADNT